MKLLIIIVLMLIHNLFINAINVLNANDIRIAQTHVIPITGKKWILKGKEYNLKIVPNRDSLLLAQFNGERDISQGISVKVWIGDKLMGELFLNHPIRIPPTEDYGPKYSYIHHSILIPKGWVKPFMKLQFSNIKTKAISNFIYPLIGQETELKLWTLPFYLFGANDKNTLPYSYINSPQFSVVSELLQKWAVSSINSKNHPIGKIDWDYLVLGPRNGNPAMYITNADQKPEDFAIMDEVLKLLHEIKNAFGEKSMAIQYYSPIMSIGKNGRYSEVGGGLGGDNVGTGDHLYSGVFIHEQGHAMNLPHAGEAYKRGENPYVNGSLLGSEWGFDTNTQEFLSTIIPKSSPNYYNCNKYAVLNNQKRCIKQSMMQSGDGHQSYKYRFSMFSDFEMALIQNYFKEGIFCEKETNNYKKWNDTSNSYYQYFQKTTRYGIEGIKENIPIERDVEVYTIILTHSTAPVNNNSNINLNPISQFYKPLKSIGNIIRQFDPTNKTDLELINLNKFIDWSNPENIGETALYCYQYDCGYTIRVTFYDDSLTHILLQQGKTRYGQIKPGLYNPISDDSFIRVGINIKTNNKKIKKLELLDTPKGWQGIPINPIILISKSF